MPPIHGLNTQSSAVCTDFEPAKGSSFATDALIKGAVISIFATIALTLASILLFPPAIPFVLVGGIVLTVGLLILNDLSRPEGGSTSYFARQPRVGSHSPGPRVYHR